MKKIQILNLNPSFDHTGILKNPVESDVVRVDEVVPLASGKGIDVARVLNILGYEDYVVANILGGGVGKLIESGLKEENINSWNYWIKKRQIFLSFFVALFNISIIKNNKILMK